MRNIWLVAQQEFLTNIRKRSFLFAVLGIPLLMGGIFAIAFFAQTAAIEGGIVAEQIGYVDNASVITQESDVFIAYDSIEIATQALDNEEIQTFFVLPATYISFGSVPLYSYGSVSDDTRDEIELFIGENLISEVESDAPAEILLDPIDATLFLENSGRELTFSGLIGLLFFPIIFAVVMMLALQLSSTFLMSGVIEEKSNHIMEILITSITPYQLLTGKLIGLGALGLIQLIIWLVVALVGTTFSNNLDIFSGIAIPPSFIAIVLLYFFLTYFLYSSILAGIGAVVGSEQESRTVAGGISLLIAIPFFFFSVLIINPDAPIFTWMTFFPFTAGMTYIMRYTFTTVPLWEVAVSMGILAVSTIIVLWSASKIFRWALLLYGKKPSIKTLWQVVMGRQEMGVVPVQEEQSV